MIPILINNRDLFHCVQEQIKFFRQCPEALVILCDQASTYPPLVQWLDRAQYILDRISHPDPAFIPSDLPHYLYRFRENMGPRGAQQVLNHHQCEHFFMSDADLDYTGINPLKLLPDLREALDECCAAEVQGVGVGLRLDDLPPGPVAEHARNYESGNWMTHRTCYRIHNC